MLPSWIALDCSGLPPSFPCGQSREDPGSLLCQLAESSLIRYRTKPLFLQVRALHKERLFFNFLPQSTSSILLGLPW
ncbi:hypothetical protein GDO81_020943 [Engystomops pustulosus]|uniref:Uncharacterized protein n=1 Tax=Engystomops pustulosus TaxID=76066 RepID=A0AAV6YR49_ENGPU|nr:hypothetical protein GDO81_020943 [Engystomops pustulosus]